MRKPLILYSTNTLLAYRVAELYYGRVHYVWCATYFNPDSLPAYDATHPPTSTPSAIYHSLSAEVAGEYTQTLAAIAEEAIGRETSQSGEIASRLLEQLRQIPGGHQEGGGTGLSHAGNGSND